MALNQKKLMPVASIRYSVYSSFSVAARYPSFYKNSMNHMYTFNHPVIILAAP
ncbi:MAG: hypothetical protein ACJAVV_001553 [Alphaproteobacteria bacterium]|jgi:hypothetical protein